MAEIKIISEIARMERKSEQNLVFSDDTADRRVHN